MHLRLENFDGPLDLLLHLIKVHELNIFNIPIALVTEQYLSFLKQVPELDFHVAGEYLAMAAQLVEMKANMLIPVLQNTQVEIKSLEEIPPDDPRRILVEQLLEFEALKKASEVLGVMSLAALDIYPSNEHKRREEEFSLFEFPVQGNAFDLIISLERVLLRFSNKVTEKVVVRAQKITIQQKMAVIKARLQGGAVVTLGDFIAECLSRYELIVIIMAMLELCKANHLVIQQNSFFTDIEMFQGPKFFEQSLDVEPT